MKKKKEEVILCRPHLYSHGGDYEEATFVDELGLILFCAIGLVLLPLYIWVLVFMCLYHLIRWED